MPCVIEFPVMMKDAIFFFHVLINTPKIMFWDFMQRADGNILLITLHLFFSARTSYFEFGVDERTA